ncbi:MAG: HemK/PrmC family methyltransferase [Bacteroidales bacterium]|nr:HemK/PrmC family methyltransferase [Bacteroidales bacterium]
MLLADFIRQGTEALAALYPEPEARSILLLLIEERLGVSRHAYLTEPALEVPAGCLAGDLARLRNGEPIQYILGFADFYGRRFNVSPAVLIPRPETEFLCHTILSGKRTTLPAGTPSVSFTETREYALSTEGVPAVSESGAAAPVHMIDLCTGSGCIAWTLAAEIPGAEVTGVDISPEALTVARGQQVACHRAPSFVQADILADPPASLPEASFDLLTANPPYVMDRERAAMRPNVLEHEPALALFVPDEDPLVFYRAVARWARTLLRPGGWGYAEINALLGPETAAVFRDAGFSGVSLLQDLGGASRFVRFFI